MRTPALIRSGWWVAVAAGVVSIVVTWVVIGPLLTDRPAVKAASDFDLSTATVDPGLIVRGMAIDGVRVLVNPGTISPQDIERFNEEERGKLLVSNDRVIGVAIGTDARAYPLRLMRWHEVVNDVVGGESIAVTYSPLCDSVVVYSTAVSGETIELGVSGLLYNSNPLLYDRRKEPATSPLWRQLDGQPMAGPEPNQQVTLQARNAELVTWEEWRTRHPDTVVMAPQSDMEKLYKRDPYHSYFGSDKLRFPVDPLPPETGLRLKDRILVVTIDDTSEIFPFTHLARANGGNEITVAGVPLRLKADAAIGVASVEALSEEHRLTSVRYTFWFAWYALKRTIPDNIRAGSSGTGNFASDPKTTQSPGGA